jgi:hypothetical protein
MDRPTVVLIGGYGRSGSTLLERMLGQIPGYFSAGELCHIWERGLIEKQLCGCGMPLPECDLWRDASGGKLIIDSSKSPAHAIAVAGIGKIDLRVAHLVRDSRAVAYSWGRKRVRPEVYWKTMYMPRFSAFRSSAVWLIKNWAMSRLGRNESVGYALIRYEDLVAQPQETLSALLDDLGLEHGSTPMDFLTGHRVTLGTNHTAAGNPMRFKTGDIELRLDDAWLKGMSAISRTFVSLLTWPGLRRYGYLNAKRPA